MKPYKDNIHNKNKFTRVFREHTPDNELEWHRDRNNRTVTVVECNGWKFQEDNKLPKTLKPGDVLKIKANQFHRIIKGSGSLVLEIEEHEAGTNQQ